MLNVLFNKKIFNFAPLATPRLKDYPVECFTS